MDDGIYTQSGLEKPKVPVKEMQADRRPPISQVPSLPSQLSLETSTHLRSAWAALDVQSAESFTRRATPNNMAEHPRIAWGDESIRVSAPIPAYIMAATVLPDGCDFSRLAQIKPRAAGKLHWRELTDRVRRDALREVATIGGQTTIVVATPLPKKKQERGRRKCLEVLLPALEAAGVDTLVLESRVLQLNSKDIDMLDALRVRCAVSRIGIEHAHADEEPSLWVPDQILGAFGDDLCGDVRDAWRQPWEEIRPSLTVLQSGM